MYPREQLEELAVRERALRWRIGERRKKMVVATAVIASRFAWVDRALALFRSSVTFGGLVPPQIGGVALGLLGRFAPRLARVARWGGLLAGPLRVLWSRRTAGGARIQPRGGAVR
ncbi:MAG TPA: hypothetical protein VK163_02505 [Opitutaceae bacterium]|nr:hypothetical protein [Opitutaceae bacterium]